MIVSWLLETAVAMAVAETNQYLVGKFKGERTLWCRHMLDPLKGHQPSLDLLCEDDDQLILSCKARTTHIERLPIPDHLILHLLRQVLEKPALLSAFPLHTITPTPTH
jgi:hypothetical protein